MSITYRPAPPKRIKMSLKMSPSLHKASGQYIRYCGKYRGEDGIVRPKPFYLGTDLQRAIEMTFELKRQWALLVASGGTVWSDSPIDPSFLRLPKPTGEGSASTAPLSETVKQAKDAYIAEMRARHEAGQISAIHFKGQRARLNKAIEVLGSFSDKPIAELSEQQLQTAILSLVKRPTANNGHLQRHRKERPPISAVYAKAVINALKWFLEWADETDRWAKPKRFAKLFKLRMKDPKAEPSAYTVDELATIYRAATERHRLWILTALNLGCDRTGLATLEVSHIDLDGLTVKRPRHKTGVYSEHPLWAETADLLRKFIPPSGIACLTERGKPLMEQTADKQRDAISIVWKRILDDAKMPKARRLSFGFLRKTGAQMVKKIGGLEVSEMYLAHNEPGLNKHYAGRSWDKLKAAMTEMRQQLQPMIDASSTPTTETLASV